MLEQYDIPTFVYNKFINSIIFIRLSYGILLSTDKSSSFYLNCSDCIQYIPPFSLNLVS